MAETPYYSDAHSQQQAAVSVAERAAAPAMQAMAAFGGDYSAIASNRQLRIPRHVLIDSAYRDAAAETERAAQEFQTDMDLPGIEKEIRESHERATATTERIMGLLADLGEKPPEEDASNTLTESEVEAMGLAMLVGARPQDVTTGIAGVADKRRKTGFENSMRGYEARQRKGMTALQIEQMNLQRDERMEEIARANKWDAKRMVAQGRMQTKQAAAEARLKGRMETLGMQIQAEREEQDRGFRQKMAAFQAGWDLQMKRLEIEGNDRREQISSLLKGLEDHIQFPDQETSEVDQVAVALKNLGFELQPGAVAMFKARGLQNYKRFQVNEQLAQLNIQAKRESVKDSKFDRNRTATQEGLDPNTGLPAFPGNVPDNSPGAIRPEAGSGEAEVQQLKKLINDLDTERGALQTEKSGFDSYVQQSAPEFRAAISRPGNKRYDSLEAKKQAVKKLEGEVRAKREAVLATARKNRNYGQWLTNQYNGTIGLINSVKDGGDGQITLTNWPTIDVGKLGAKEAKKEIRRWFRSFTGFDTDDSGLKQLVEEFNVPVDVPLPPGFQGPVRTRR